MASPGLAGCGQAGAGSDHGAHAGTSASSSPEAAGAPMKLASVCAGPMQVRSVRVTRLPTLTQLGQTKPLPKKLPSITVRDRAKARALARLVCGLPVMPHRAFSCPVAIGGGYQLAFMSGRSQLPPVTVKASGCETVTGTGGHLVRRIARSPKFWTALSQLTGIAAPAHTP
jgi:hypothetical protein